MSNQNQENQNAETAAQAAPAAPKEIIRGRMPVAVVALVRFGNKSGESTKAKADAFGTTVGKVDDIAKNRNFAYVTKDFKPTEQQKADALAWLERHPGGKPQDIVDEPNALPTASAEEAAAFEATRSANRGQPAVTKEGEPANGGGGNRRGKGKASATTAAPAADAGQTGEALLS